MVFCSAYGCNTSSTSEIRFFKFPLQHPNLLNQWLINVRRQNFKPKNYHRLCYKHFERQCFELIGNHSTLKLKVDAIPSFFKPPRKTYQKWKKREMNNGIDKLSFSREKSTQTNPKLMIDAATSTKKFVLNQSTKSQTRKILYRTKRCQTIALPGTTIVYLVNDKDHLNCYSFT